MAADYEWIKGDDLFEAYCVTLVRGVTPREFMDRIGAQIKFDSLPLGDEEYLDEKFSEIFYNDWTDLHGDGEMFIGATTVTGAGGDWTLAVERNGYLGMNATLMASVSAGTTLVSHSYCLGEGYFRWFEDGDLRLEFQAQDAGDRWGSTPNACLAEMQQIGFQLDNHREEVGPTNTAAFALAERLTGVRVTDDMLYGDTVYLCGTV